jgi:hypothetical protein
MPNFPPVVFGATTSSSELLSFSLSLSLELPPAQNLAFAAAISALLCLSGDCDSHTIRGRPSNFIFSFERLKKREGNDGSSGMRKRGSGSSRRPSSRGTSQRELFACWLSSARSEDSSRLSCQRRSMWNPMADSSTLIDAME